MTRRSSTPHSQQLAPPPEQIRFNILLNDEITKVRTALGAPHNTGHDENLVAEKINDVESAKHTPLSDLRSRLLVANQEVYGEYDRFAAEGDFRVNLSLPTIALGILVTIQLGIGWGVGLVIVGAVLFIQGRARRLLAEAVLMRAVLDELIEHPVSARAREAIESVSRMGDSAGGPSAASAPARTAAAPGA